MNLQNEETLPLFLPDLASEKSILVRWLKKVGEQVEKGEDIAEVETDKVVFTLPSPYRGRIHSFCVDEGAEIAPGQMLARILPDK
ncbi:MAG: lipoyl domain-containing protein [bacterium]